MSKELSQPETRAYRTYRDQHDREWGAPIDKRTGHAVGPWEPKFVAPWYPEAKYVKHHPRDDRLVQIDYDSNIHDLKEAHNAYDDLRLKAAMNMYGSAFPTKLGKTAEEDPPELREIVGLPPRPLAFPEAAKEGNRWVLGFTNTIPTWAYALVAAEEPNQRKYLDADEELETRLDIEEEHDPGATGGKRVQVRGPGKSAYTDFVKEQSALGKNLKEISQMWRERKLAAAAR